MFLVWTKAPLMFDNALIAVDRATTARQAHDGEVTRLGDKPIIVGFAANGVNSEIAARPEHLALVTGLLTKPEQAPPATALV
jgi:hypothetical protein